MMRNTRRKSNLALVIGLIAFVMAVFDYYAFCVCYERLLAALAAMGF